MPASYTEFGRTNLAQGQAPAPVFEFLVEVDGPLDRSQAGKAGHVRLEVPREQAPPHRSGGAGKGCVPAQTAGVTPVCIATEPTFAMFRVMRTPRQRRWARRGGRRLCRP